ncbi:hypothetical protein ACF09H_20260 [Streptomyces sp. NPDC014983]|uniref:hypothetical protein n=1 Tax=Streptomyces sp. NPDC014983 TaxID=3364933 RepID=UPI0036F82031
MLSRKTTVVALATITALLGAAGPAAAGGASTTSSASTDSTGDAAARALCVRATRVAHRIDRDLTRLNGPVTQRGSIARLQKRVDNAEAAGHDKAGLDDRLTYRKSLVPLLQQRSQTLTQVTDWCTAHNHGATT